MTAQPEQLNPQEFETITAGLGVYKDLLVVSTTMRTDENGKSELAIIPFEHLQKILQWVPVEDVKFLPKGFIKQTQENLKEG